LGTVVMNSRRWNVDLNRTMVRLLPPDP